MMEFIIWLYLLTFQVLKIWAPWKVWRFKPNSHLLKKNACNSPSIHWWVLRALFWSPFVTVQYLMLSKQLQLIHNHFSFYTLHHVSNDWKTRGRLVPRNGNRKVHQLPQCRIVHPQLWHVLDLGLNLFSAPEVLSNYKVFCTEYWIIKSFQ